MDFEDLDSLLDIEEELMEEGGHKRGRADLRSQAEAAASLAAAGVPGVKRPRTGPPSGAGTTAGPSQRTFDALSETEQERVLLALAADSQLHDSRTLAAAATTTGAVPLSSLLHESEEQRLLALAADTQPSQGIVRMPTASGRPTASRPAGGGGGGAAGGYGEGEFEDDDAALEALFEQMYEPEVEPANATGAAAQQQPAREQPAHQQHQARTQVVPPAAGARQQGQQAAADFLPRRLYVPPAREVYRIRGASVPVTSQDGERVYCQLQAPAPAGVGRRLDMAGALRRARGGLLPESISSLLQAVEKDQYDRVVAETAAAAARERAQPGIAAHGERRRSGASGAGAASGRAALWVEKYAPRGYIDLLSDEQINREVVRWLKSWDACVFGTAPPAPPAARGAGNRFQQRGAQGEPGGALDALGRPEHKVILIAGPPGLGKTTLAHICATHCGYRPVEINASDDRSAGALQSRVLDAVEMQSVMGQRRPNCVIIDEIDGAAGGAEGRSGIAALLKIVKAAPGKAGGSKQGGKGAQQRDGVESDSDMDEEEGGSGGGRGAGARAVGRRVAGGAVVGSGGRQGSARQQLRPLMRPIICICNDLYAPALRPLRDLAKVFHFKKPQAERLAQRLQAICAEEGLRAEKSTLRLLVERTECDIRSCLNTLQFLSKRQAAVRQADLLGLRVGQKDMTKGAFQVWAELLQKRKAPGIVGKAGETEAQRVQRLYDTLQDFGEADLVLGGVHENLLGLRYFDMALQRTTSALTCLGDADRFLRSCHTRGEYALLKYVPAPLVALSGLVAGPDRPQLQWPRAAFDSQRRLASNLTTLRGWMLRVSPAALAATSGRSMVLEVLPQLVHILAPAMRPVSQHLYSPQEMAAMRQLVDALLTYNLRFGLEPTPEEAEEELQRQQAEAAAGEQQQATGVRGVTAEPPLRFRPAVHVACTFPGMAPKGRQLPAAVRQMVSHEADMEAIRRAEVARRGGPDGPGPAALGAASQQQHPAAGAPAAAQPGVVHATLAQRMKAAAGAAGAARAAQRARKATWLDQLKEQRLALGGPAGVGGEGGGGKPKFPVLYKFHEGYTNAVKRPVLMRDLAR